jgi:Zn-dependent peptidase ImmA (M78 family)
MAKRIFATVRPDILVWARTSAGLGVTEAALAGNITIEALTAWEGGDESPSMSQLRKLAEAYKRPLAVFYLQEVPVKFQVLSDLRRGGLAEQRPFSPVLTQEIRASHQRRELAHELSRELGEEISPYPFHLGDKTGEEAGAAIRQFLGIGLQELNSFGGDATGRRGFNAWRSAIEETGVMVFQCTKVSQDEASGFALAYDLTPVIVVNRKDVPQRRLFSLLHEFAHVALRESGVSDLNLNEKEVNKPDIEFRCNSIAAAALMPLEVLLPEFEKWSVKDESLADEAIVQMARRFGVSRPALLLRLVDAGRLRWKFFFEKIATYKEEYAKEQAQKRPPVEMKRNIPQESISNLGKPYISLVLGNYYQRNLTLSDVAGYLGVRVRHIENLQRRMAG